MTPTASILSPASGKDILMPTPTDRCASRPQESFNVRKVCGSATRSASFVREDSDAASGDQTPEIPQAQLPAGAGRHRRPASHARIQYDCRYLAAKHRAIDLIRGPRRAAGDRQWMDWVAYDVTHALLAAFLGGSSRSALVIRYCKAMQL